MSYVEQNLMQGERVVYRTQLHWIHFVPPAIVAAGLLILLAPLLFSGDVQAGATVAGFFLVIIMPFVALMFLLRFITWKTSEFAVTNQRLVIKVGWIRRKTSELLLSKIESVSVDQGILGRMLGYGDITVTGTGGASTPYKQIADPLKLRTQVNSAATA